MENVSSHTGATHHWVPPFIKNATSEDLIRVYSDHVFWSLTISRHEKRQYEEAMQARWIDISKLRGDLLAKQHKESVEQARLFWKFLNSWAQFLVESVKRASTSIVNLNR